MRLHFRLVFDKIRENKFREDTGWKDNGDGMKSRWAKGYMQEIGLQVRHKPTIDGERFTAKRPIWLFHIYRWLVQDDKFKVFFDKWNFRFLTND